nr:UDP-galactopyranose mutase [Lachnospiraceae bacterium]
WQGVPTDGYTAMVRRMFDGAEIRLDTDYFSDRAGFDAVADKIVFTGMIDRYFDGQLGTLEYRSLRFETEVLDCSNYQGNTLVNYTEYEIPYTRCIEHKHFVLREQLDNPKTVITREYPATWKPGDEPYYPINDEKNDALYRKYRELAEKDPKVIFGGRLGGYRYLDMDKVIALALSDVKKYL